MADQLVQVRIIWDGQYIPLPHKDLRFSPVHVTPEPGHPTGRKGLQLATAWKDMQLLQSAIGMLTLDGDVVADPHDVRTMHTAINRDPGSVWTAWIKNWPISTNQTVWEWSHMTAFPADQRQRDLGETHPDYRFSFGFTYLPARLMDLAVTKGLRTRKFPGCDMWLHDLAHRQGFTVRVVPGLHVKHLNY